METADHLQGQDFRSNFTFSHFKDFNTDQILTFSVKQIIFITFCLNHDSSGDHMAVYTVCFFFF